MKTLSLRASAVFRLLLHLRLSLALGPLILTSGCSVDVARMAIEQEQICIRVERLQLPRIEFPAFVPASARLPAGITVQVDFRKSLARIPGISEESGLEARLSEIFVVSDSTSLDFVESMFVVLEPASSTDVLPLGTYQRASDPPGVINTLRLASETDEDIFPYIVRGPVKLQLVYVGDLPEQALEFEVETCIALDGAVTLPLEI